MIVDHVTVGPFDENCFLLVDEDTATAVIVDPGDEGDRIAAMAAGRGVTPSAVWLTHAHLDHIGAVSAVRRTWPGIPVYLHAADRTLYGQGKASAESYGLPFEQPAPADREFTEGDTLSIGATQFAVWHVPGHAPGHVAFVGDGIVVSGDCIFAGSVGRTDFPYCDPKAFTASLKRLMSLPDSTVVYPGHGPATTIARERSSNPFLNGAARVPGAY